MVISKRYDRFFPLIISLLLALFLFLLVKDFIRTVILEPLLYVFWFIGLILESIPQGVIWVGFILVMLIITLASFKKGEPQKSQSEMLPYSNTGRVERLARMLNRAQNNPFAKWLLASELKRVTRKLLTPPEQEKKSINYQELDLPPEITAFFEAQQPTKWSIWEWLDNREHDETKTALDLDPDIVIQYLEKRMNL
jgi:cell division protein FtsW (lipid II flippase)